LGEDDELTEEICNNLFETNRDWYVEEEYDESGELVYSPPPLDDVWLTEPERREQKECLSRQRERTAQRQRVKWVDKEPVRSTPDSNDDAPPALLPRNVVSDSDSNSSDDDSSAGDASESEGDCAPALPPEGDNSNTNSNTKRPQWGRDPDGRLRRLNITGHSLSLGSKQVPVHAVRLSRKKKKYRQRIRYHQEKGDRALNSMILEDELPSIRDVLESPLAKFIHFAANACGYNGTAEDLMVNWIHPLFLKAKAKASKHDNPNWWQAMNGPFADEYWQAACKEIRTLEEMGAWDVVDRPSSEKNVIKSTWAFKLKRFPDGLAKKFKTRFCARGDMQLEGVDFFKTYAPVVQWTTVRLLLILEVLLGLKSKQGDITATFLHANVPEDEEIYVEMPLGFEKKGKVLKLKKTLYGLRQSPRAFWQYLTKKMNECRMQQTKFDPCLFVGGKVMCICYVDDLIFWSLENDDIDELANKLIAVGVDLEEEDNAAGFLGVQMERDTETGLLELKQTDLIDRILETMGLDAGTAKSKWTPAESKPLVKDSDGAAISGDFSYSSMVGMLLYLAGHSRPDITYAVNCAARYMFCPKHSHELALKRIGRYLKATRNHGLVLNPSKELKIDDYPDADFAGMYGYEVSSDPSCVKSRTGYTITVADFPVVWQSKLQTETATSTMEAEIIALAHSAKELFPIMDMVDLLGNAVGLPVGDTTMNVSIHEDNLGALILAETLPPQFTPRSKHYAITTIWFREQIVARGIKLLKIDATEQLGDIFTKGLARAAFEYLRKRLMGW